LIYFALIQLKNFDLFIKQLLLVPVIEKEAGNLNIQSVEFSPAKTNHVAIAGWGGAKIIDICQPNQ